MTQEEKKLLAKDLSARLPYGVKGLITIHITMSHNITPNRVIDGAVYDRFVNLQDSWYDNIPTIKPYLRPLSSMTEKEKEEYDKTKDKIAVQWDDYGAPMMYEYAHTIKTFDWLNEHHFDYRNLIRKGLALVAPDGMYTKEDKQ